MDYFKILPVEITLDILSRLPTEAVIDCKQVCTNWNNLISHHPSFYQMYLNHLLRPSDSASADDTGKLGFLTLTLVSNIAKFHYFEYNESTTTPTQRTRRVNFTSPFMYYTRFVGSCNGLICLAQNLLVCICNPITREYVMLPEFKTDCDISFGYVSSTNEYKVVGIYASKSNVDVHIYTLGSGKGWRNLGNFNSHLGTIFACYRGVFANGALYWLDRILNMIVSFDLDEEKFCENLSLPPLPPSGNWWYYRIGVLDPFLYVAVDGGDGFDIWRLKQKSVNHEMEEQPEEHQSFVWSKDFRVRNSELLAVTKSGVLNCEDCYINIYDTKISTSKRLVKFKHRLYRVSPHKNTFISLNELGEEDTRVMESMEIEETKSREQPLKPLSQHVRHKNFNFKKACGF